MEKIKEEYKDKLNGELIEFTLKETGCTVEVFHDTIDGIVSDGEEPGAIIVSGEVLKLEETRDEIIDRMATLVAEESARLQDRIMSLYSGSKRDDLSGLTRSQNIQPIDFDSDG